MGKKQQSEDSGWYAYAPGSGETYRPHRPGLPGRIAQRVAGWAHRITDPLETLAEPFDPSAPDEPLPKNIRGTRSVRFFQEYGCDSPFWGIGAYGPLEDNQLGLSPDLDRRSREFMQFWDAHFHHDTEWDSPASAETWQRMGDELLHDVRQELSGTDIVILDKRW